MRRPILLTALVLLAAGLPAQAQYGGSPYYGYGGYGPYAGTRTGGVQIQTQREADGYRVVIHAPGRSADDIHVQARGNALHVNVSGGGRGSSGYQGPMQVPYGQGYSYQYGYGGGYQQTSRSFTLPRDADTSDMTRQDGEGVVEVFIPRRR
jgi:HSP20 family molecular chaperone IbpA